MNRSLRNELFGQICGAQFPKENLKCFQLLPIQSEPKNLVTKLVEKISDHSDQSKKCLTGIRDISKLDLRDSENWDLIKAVFRSNLASCMWVKNISEYDANMEYILQEHIESFKVKLKFELLFKLKEKLQNGRLIVNEVAWHKMISWFNAGHTNTLDQYLNECLTEVTEMKEHKLIRGVTLYDLVLKDDEPFERIDLYRNEDHSKLLDKFSVYRENIEIALEGAYKRAELIKRIEDQEVYLRRTVSEEKTSLDYGSVRHLVRFFKTDDLENVLSAFGKKEK